VRAMSAESLPMAGTRACRVRLPHATESAAQARRRVRDTIRAWDIPADADAVNTAVLAVGELVTSALTHGKDETVTLAIRYTHGQLRIDVPGTSPEPPVAAESRAEQLAGGGRGLVLVAGLAATWGWYRTPAGGKAVYATIGLEDAR
jgi:anti-sigma regulatory factor (Ser/Thr protein kinase)